MFSTEGRETDTQDKNVDAVQLTSEAHLTSINLYSLAGRKSITLTMILIKTVGLLITSKFWAVFSSYLAGLEVDGMFHE